MIKCSGLNHTLSAINVSVTVLWYLSNTGAFPTNPLRSSANFPFPILQVLRSPKHESDRVGLLKLRYKSAMSLSVL
jgi:hypothetical protein